MLTGKLHNGNIVTTLEYNSDLHGTRVYCIDKSCNAPLIYVAENDNRAAHFKTSGKGDSKHSSQCGFYQQLDLIESISKVKQYQEDGVHSNKEIIIRLSMNRIDPDREVAGVEREKGKKENQEPKVKNESLTPNSITSVKGVVKLLTEYEPDVLSSILINVGGGRKVNLSELVVDQKTAHRLLWQEEGLKDVGYFIYGKVSKFTKLEKVLYINFEEVEVPFTVVIFQKYWNEFDYTEKQLVGRNVLVYGHLRKNDYQNKQTTEMIIKSSKYIEIFKTKAAVNKGEI
ncbi:hypothetical protein ACWE42_11175 [Sutcliffiella cohnii]